MPAVPSVRVVELFAGVGGFRIGLEGSPDSRDNSGFKVIWANQWEPSTKTQHAAEVYADRWSLVRSNEDEFVYVGKDGDILVNKNIAKIDAADVPDHDLLCGGFPCQDYSVAKTLDKAKGLQGKKGVLWWEIYRIIKAKKPKHVLLENVDRLTKSPVNQRGRDFAVMLSCLSELGYVVEWRVINAAEYGLPQRRRRVFILAHKKGTEQYTSLSRKNFDPIKWLTKDGTIAKAFPVEDHSSEVLKEYTLLNGGEDIPDLSKRFNKNGLPGNRSPFDNCGIMSKNRYWTFRSVANYDGEIETLGSLLVTPGKVPDVFILDAESVTRDKGWSYQKGAKKPTRKGRDGFTYTYSEGAVGFPDSLNKPSRTIITGEGGVGPSRFKHVIRFKPTKGQKARLELDSEECNKIRRQLGLKQSEWIRRLVPIELERLNQFPDNHTEGVSDSKRAFFMGNALVIGIIKRLSEVFWDN